MTQSIFPDTLDRFAVGRTPPDALTDALNKVQAEIHAGPSGWAISARYFGVRADGATDDTEALQDALDEAADSGGVVLLPRGIMPVSNTLSVPSHTRLVGGWAGQWETGIDLNRGPVLKWVGANGGTVLRVFNAGLVSLDGLSIHLNDKPGVTGLLIDSTNNPATQNVSVQHLSVYGGPAAPYRTANTVGVQIGTSGTNGPSPGTGYQSDMVSIRHARLHAVTTGVVVNSNNAWQAGALEHVVGHQVVNFCRLVVSTLQSIRSCFWGFDTDVVGRGIEIEGPHDAVLIQQCQAEGGAAGSTMLRVLAASGGDVNHPVTLLSNHCDHPVSVAANRRIASIGNTYNDDFTTSQAGILVESVGDAFASGKDFVTTSGGHVARLGGRHNASDAAAYAGATVTVVAGTTIQPDLTLPFCRLTSSGDVTVTAVPSLSAVGAAEGQRLLLQNAGSFAITLQDFQTLGSSQLSLMAASVTLRSHDTLDLVWYSALGAWVQVPRDSIRRLYGSVTWDPPNVSINNQQSTTVTVTGAAVGDPVALGFSQDLQGMLLTGYVSAADTVTVILRNGTGGGIDLASGTLRAVVDKLA